MAAYELSDQSLLKLISFLFWSGLYLHTALNWPNKNPEWSSRMVTLLHGSIATIIGLSQCDIVHLTPWRLHMKISHRHYALMLWSWGYFAFDLLWCLVYEPGDYLILSHHISALVAITVYMKKNYTGCTFACNIAMMEITNPLLQTRWFLKYEGHGTSQLFFIVETTYICLFVIVRAFLGSYLVCKIMKSNLYDWDEKIISVVFYFVSLALVYQVLGYVMHKYRPKIVRTVPGREGDYLAGLEKPS